MSSSADATAFQKYWRVCAYCFIASFAATTFGFDQGTMGGFLAMQSWLRDFGYYDEASGKYAIKAGSTTTIYGVMLAFAFVTALGSGSLGARWGAKWGLIFTAVTGLVGSGLQMIPHYAPMLVGKAFTGMSLGSAGVFAISYWSETAPVKLRGMIVTLYQININIPNLLGACINQGTYQLDTRWAYWGPLLVQMFPPVVLVCTVWLMPNSPRWLISRNRTADAHKAIREIRGRHYSQDELDQEIEETVAFNELEKELESKVTWRECFVGTNLRRVLIAMMCQGGQQVMGIAFISGYSTYFFNMIGFTDAFLITVIINGCQVIGPFVSVILVRYIGRRTLLIVGCGVNAICMFAFAIIAEAAPQSKAASSSLIAFICIFCFTFAATWGPVCPIVIGEVGSNRLRSKTIALGLASNWLLCTIILTALPYLIDTQYANLGTKVGFIFGSMTTVLFVCVIFFLPETKDRSLEEIDEMFLNNVPAWKFKNYVCTGQVAGYDVHQIKDEKRMVVEKSAHVEKA